MLRLLFWLCFACSFSLYAQTGDIAKLRVANPEHDFGMVSEGDKLKHEFEFTNVGKGDLLIEKAVPSCGCTVSEVGPKIVAPGEKGLVKVVLDTTGFSGQKTKTVRLYTNDPRTRYLQLSLKANIVSDVAFEPKHIALADVIKDGDAVRNATQEFQVKILKGSTTRIVGAEVTSEYLEVRQQSSTPRQGNFLLRVLPSAPIGELRDSITVSLKGGRRDVLSIPVFVSVAGVLEASQSVVSFGVIEGSTVQRRSVKIANRGSDTVTFDSLSTTSPAISGKIVEINPGKDFVLHIDLDPSKVLADIKATVRIQMKEASIPALPISVVGILPPR